MFAKALLIASFLCFVLASREAGCPPQEDIFPCVCTKIWQNQNGNLLTCSNITDVEVLSSVFANMARHRFADVMIENSVIQYIPSDKLLDVEVKKLTVKNVVVVNLFPSPPETLANLEFLNIEDTVVLSSFQWKDLEPIKRLKMLRVANENNTNSIKNINADFGRYVSKDLRQLVIFGAPIKEIGTGVLKDFSQLEYLSISSCKLKDLKRDSLPGPSSLKYISLSDNQLEVIESDLFSEMPFLKMVSLKGNKISTLMGSTFKNSPVNFLDLGGNPLRCDCRLEWIIKKPLKLIGSCSYPALKNGIQLSDLTKEDFDCYDSDERR